MSKDAEDREGTHEDRDENALRQTLQDLIRDVDREGLDFLIRQARVLIHNRKVEEYNRKLGEAEIEITEKRVKKTPLKLFSPEVEIVERGEGKHFFIVVNQFRIYFTLQEMRQLVRISHAADDERDGANRLYSWFKRERSDFLVDGGIASARHPSLLDLYNKLVRTYKPKEEA
jgi:hypothetical protein